MDADFATTWSSRPTAGGVAVLLSGTMRNPTPTPNPNANPKPNPNPNQVLLSGTMRGFKERCVPSLRENIVQPNAQHGVAIYLATYVESDCGKKIRDMRRAGALTGVSLRDGVTVLPIVSLRAYDINATYRQYADPTLTLTLTL